MFCDTSKKHFHFSSENGETPKFVVGFLLEKDAFQKQIRELVWYFADKVDNDND